MQNLREMRNAEYRARHTRFLQMGDNCLKGQSREICLLLFFPQSAHSGPIRDALGPF